MNDRKKIIISLLSLLMASSCGAPQEETPQKSSGNPQSEIPAEPSVTELPEDSERAVIWAHEPDMELSSVVMLEGYPYEFEYPGYLFEKTGYPQDWGNSPASDIVKNGTYTDRHYTRDAIIAEKDGKFGIMDFSGNVLYPLSVTFAEDSWFIGEGAPIVWEPSGSFYLPETVSDDFTSAQVFTSDFKSTEDGSILGGLGGDPGCWYCIRDGVQAKYDYYESKWVSAFTPPASYSMNYLLTVSDDSLSTLGMTLVTPEGIGPTVKGKAVSDFINGYYFVTDDLDADIYDDLPAGAKLAAADAYKGSLLTDFIYEDAGFFSCGYAPVKKNGQYGFIDTAGNEVTEFLFDSASYLYEGKTYVSLDGKFGILDLVSTIEAGIPVTSENCFVTD